MHILQSHKHWVFYGRAINALHGGMVPRLETKPDDSKAGRLVELPASQNTGVSGDLHHSAV